MVARPKEFDELMKIPEAAKALGKRAKTLRQWCWRREIEFLKIGHGIFIKRSTIERILQDAEIHPRAKDCKGNHHV